MKLSQIIALAGLLVSQLATAGVVVIGHPDSTAELTKNQVNNLFMGKSKVLPNGVRAHVMELNAGDATRQDFHAKVTNKNEAQLKSYWARMVFTGKAAAPAAKANATAMKAAIASTPGGVGYIDEADLDASVKVLFKP